MDELHDRKKRLSEKLNIAQQKIVRLNYLEKLSSDLSQQISDRIFITSPEKEAILEKISSHSSIFNFNNLSTVKLTLDSYFYKEYSWTNQVIQEVNKLSSSHDKKEAYYLPSMENSPIYSVNFGWARENFSRLWCLSSDYDLCIVSVDFSVAIIASNYGGYLYEDPNPDEVIYDLELWGF